MSQSIFSLKASKEFVLVNEHGEEFFVERLSVLGPLLMNNDLVLLELAVKRRSMKRLKGLRTLTLQNKRLKAENDLLRETIRLMALGEKLSGEPSHLPASKPESVQ